MPTKERQSQEARKGGRRMAKKSSFPPLLSFFLAAVVTAAAIKLILMLLPGKTAAADPTPAPVPTPAVSASLPALAPTIPPSPSAPAPTPTPAPVPVPVTHDFTAPVPEREAVGDDWFADAVFIGDSRTDGLKLYGGIPQADFIQQTGITVFEVGDKKVIRRDGQKYTVLEALGLKQYAKVYLMLGVNELGYFNDKGFETTYAQVVDSIRAIQPNAVIYLQNLVSINPDKAKANNQPYYVTNEKIADYNQIIARIAAEKHTLLVDVNAALVDENGILPRDGTTDGVHFSKSYYVKWYDYLKTHTADPETYWAGQAGIDA